MGAEERAFRSYLSRAEKLVTDADEYAAAKASDPEFYRAADSLLHGSRGNDSEAAIDRMVAELNERYDGTKNSVLPAHRPYNLTKALMS